MKPSDVRETGSVPTSGSIFFTIFQSFMSGPENKPYFGQYPADFFDLIIVDECHRGGAKDESRWRGILEYFSSAVQIGLTRVTFGLRLRVTEFSNRLHVRAGESERL